MRDACPGEQDAVAPRESRISTNACAEELRARERRITAAARLRCEKHSHEDVLQALPVLHGSQTDCCSDESFASSQVFGTGV